ncbi:phosphate signaling complex protein PhoU [Alkalicaulis satelles]|uniref:Phosphate-specific transport system accessory protein PhoU n=1 Tax=Alkalicaulis satelles TaxID=2609175 RepID=A0A5M6ZKX0_9PROT|nr:phosphate signaling complex protein PhoU [Alkalicaulis satelles]KAA5804960.1 phosphate signaling complex protein PhoU [Alkalicaulis satelles]
MTNQVKAPHIVKAFSEELEQLSADVAAMGGLAESLVSDALEAAATRDGDLAAGVVARDAQVDAMQRDIEKKIIRLLALRHPIAQDLRVCIAALKIVTDLERVGDLAKSIARRVPALNDSEPTAFAASVDRMGKLVLSHMHEVLDAYVTGETARAVAVWERDDDVDEHYNALFRELVRAMRDDHVMIGPGAHLLFIAKNLERIGDHATNIAEVIHYLVTGRELASERPRGPRPEQSA